jgi:hypothetical protein
MQYVFNHFSISTKRVMGQQIFVKRSNAKVEKIYSAFTPLLSEGGRTDGLTSRINEVNPYPANVENRVSS